jgi:hypothetical protein
MCTNTWNFMGCPTSSTPQTMPLHPLHPYSDNLPFYFYNVFECECLGNGDIVLLFMLLCKWNHIWGTLKINFFGLSPNVISIAYVIVKSSQDELFDGCITLAYECSKCFTFMMLVSNWMVLFGNFFIISLFESYIVKCRSSAYACIWFKIQWLLFMKICLKQLVRYLCIVSMIVYVCCWYPNNYNFWTYIICVATAKCWLFNHPFRLRRIISSILVHWNSSCQ